MFLSRNWFLVLFLLQCLTNMNVPSQASWNRSCLRFHGRPVWTCSIHISWSNQQLSCHWHDSDGNLYRKYSCLCEQTRYFRGPYFTSKIIVLREDEILNWNLNFSVVEMIFSPFHPKNDGNRVPPYSVQITTNPSTWKKYEKYDKTAIFTNKTHKNYVVPITISKTIIFPWIMRAISVIASSLVVYQPFHVIISLIWVIVRCSRVSDWWLIFSSNSVFRGIDTLWVIF